jgi:quinol monooxygenase YgiN
MRLLTHLMFAMTIMPLALAPQASAQEDSTSHMITYIEVTPAAKAQAATLLKELAAASKQDAGLLRFELLERTAPTNQYVIVEAWKDEAALNAHAGAAHAKQFRDKLQPHLMAPIDDRLSIVTTASPVAAAAGAGVYVVTHVDVAPPNRDKIIVALKALADPTRKDKGNVRYDVLQQKNRTNHFTVVEAWTDQAANDAHEIAAHTKEFRATLAPLTGALYDQRWYKPL